MTYVIEVIVPIYKGRKWIDSCLVSLQNQTIDATKFHVTLVFNGEDDGAAAVAKNFLHENPSFPGLLLHSKVANAAAARNLGISSSRATHVTFIDVDDIVSPDYLELLHSAIADDVVPAALMVDIDLELQIDARTAIAEEFLQSDTAIASPEKCQRILSYMVGKVIPIEWAIETPLAEDLRSGEDVAFYGTILTKKEFHVSLWPGALGATYFRRKVPGSLSRKPATRDFLVSQRTDVINELSRALSDNSNSRHRSITQSYMNSQASFVKRYLAENPNERQSVMDEITARKIAHFPWRVISGTPEDLVIAYNFAPYTDTGATIVSKRIREWARPVDIISNSMGATRESLPENLLLAKPYIAQHHELKAPTSFASPAGVEAFMSLGLKTFEHLKKSGRHYKRLYSRSMWPASHFLAAKIKNQCTDLEWTAEFSDPVRLTTEGTYRTVSLTGTPLYESFKEIILHDVSKSLESIPDLYAWTELLPYIYADKLVFTNTHQLETMLSYAPEKIREQIEKKASIQVHPTLPSTFYEIGTPSIPPGKRINIGYFGDFYSTRGLHEVIDGLRNLSNEERSNIALSVFTSKLPDELDTNRLDDLNDVIHLASKVSYLDFLATLNQYDVLIVNDAETKTHHDRNPYLPSKLSDYRGSKSAIWSIVEDGSPLSKFDSDFTSQRGDAIGAHGVLKEIIDRLSTRKVRLSETPRDH